MQISVRTSKVENSETGLKGLATVTFGDSFKVQSIAIMEGKNGMFVSMPSYKTKQEDDKGNSVYKDICNPITKDFRDKLYEAILDSFNSGNEVLIGEADDRKIPNFGVKVNPIENGGSTVAIARLYLEDSFVVSNIAVRRTDDNKFFAAMPSYKTNQQDEKGKPVYKDICFPATKDFHKMLNSAVVNAYLETTVGITQPDHATLPEKDSYTQAVEAGVSFDEGFQDPAKSKPEKAKKAATKEEYPKTIKDRLNEAEEKKTSQPTQKRVCEKISVKME